MMNQNPELEKNIKKIMENKKKENLKKIQIVF